MSSQHDLADSVIFNMVDNVHTKQSTCFIACRLICLFIIIFLFIFSVLYFGFRFDLLSCIFIHDEQYCQLYNVAILTVIIAASLILYLLVVKYLICGGLNCCYLCLFVYLNKK